MPVAVALVHLLNLLAFLLCPLLSPPYNIIIPYIEYKVKHFLLILTTKKGAVTKQPLKFKKLLVDYMKSTNNFFVFLSKKGPEGPFSLV